MPSTRDSLETASDMPSEPLPGRGSVGDLARLFLRLGATAFGGPAVAIALFRDETVVRRKWLTDEQFLDMLGATNLIPGPNSTEMAMHLGYERAGRRGLIVAGVCFIFPAFVIVLALAFLYVNYGSAPAAEGLLYGIKPVIMVVIGQAVWGLLRKAVKNRYLGLMGLTTLALYLLGMNELLLLFGGGVVTMVVGYLARYRTEKGSGSGMLTLLSLPVPVLGPMAATDATPVSLTTLFLTFLKIGALLYGGGYVLLAFVRNDFVERLGWLTN